MFHKTIQKLICVHNFMPKNSLTLLPHTILKNLCQRNSTTKIHKEVSSNVLKITRCWMSVEAKQMHFLAFLIACDKRKSICRPE